MKFFNINQTITISTFSLMVLYAPAGLTQNSHSFGDIAARLNTMICQGAGIDCNSQVQIGGQVLNHVPGDPLSQPKIQEILRYAIKAFLDDRAQRVAFDFAEIAFKNYQCNILNPYIAASLSNEDQQVMKQIAFDASFNELDRYNNQTLTAQQPNIISNCAKSVASDLPVLLAAGTARDIPLNTLMPQTYQCISNIVKGSNGGTLEQSYQTILNNNISVDANRFPQSNTCVVSAPQYAQVLDNNSLQSPIFLAIHDYASRIPMPPINHPQPTEQPLQELPAQPQSLPPS